jgi:hypothetical protein
VRRCSERRYDQRGIATLIGFDRAKDRAMLEEISVAGARAQLRL